MGLLVMDGSDKLIPRLVGKDLIGRQLKMDGAESSLGARSLDLSQEDWTLLGLVAREPWLASREIGEVLGWATKQVRYHRRRLLELGLLRMLGPEESEREVRAQLAEATQNGLRAVSAHEGLSLARAVEYLGLVGGDPERPIGSRSLLLQNLRHTREVAGVLADLYRSARALRERGLDDEVVEWRNAAASARRHVRPDGYVDYRHRGELYGAFIELDRGTMRRRDYHLKLRAYGGHLQSGRYARDYLGFPTILFLVPDRLAEKRILSVVRRLAAEGGPRLPILLTHHWRRGADPDGPSGLLGPIWREAYGYDDGLQFWPLGRERGPRPAR